MLYRCVSRWPSGPRKGKSIVHPNHPMVALVHLLASADAGSDVFMSVPFLSDFNVIDQLCHYAEPNTSGLNIYILLGPNFWNKSNLQDFVGIYENRRQKVARLHTVSRGTCMSPQTVDRPTIRSSNHQTSHFLPEENSLSPVTPLIAANSFIIFLVSIMPERSSLQPKMSSVNFAMPSDADAQKHVHDRDGGSHSWAYRALSFLHSRTLQITFCSLLLLDVAILFVELFLLATYPSCRIIERDAISCCPSTNEDHSRWLAEEHHEFCDVGKEAEIDAGCDEHKWERVHTAEEVLFIVTILILVIFFIELNVTMVALRPQIFFRQFWYLLDYVIVTTSLTLELVYEFLGSQNASVMAGVLVVGRIWRFIRIGHGILEVSHELASDKYEKLLAYTEDLEDLLKTKGIQIPSERQKNPENILSQIQYEHRHHKHHGSPKPQGGSQKGSGSTLDPEEEQ